MTTTNELPTTSIPASAAVPGDIVMLWNGDDGTVIEATDILTDGSIVFHYAGVRDFFPAGYRVYRIG